MFCLATFDSGNFAYSLCRILEKKGFIFEVVATPCQISKGGCSYSLKFPVQHVDMVIKESIENKTPVREIYKLVSTGLKNTYEKIYG